MTELVYEDVFRVWETIWAAEYICSRHFVLFIAAALVQLYRDVIIANNMDFTDISTYLLPYGAFYDPLMFSVIINSMLFLFFLLSFSITVKFFNEMAEKHDVQAILKVARNLVHQIQTLIEDEK